MRTTDCGAGVYARLWVLGGLLGLSACPSQDQCKNNPTDAECIAERCKNNPTDAECIAERCKNNPTDAACVTGPGAPTQGHAIGIADRPLCAVLDAEGRTVYLTAHDGEGRAQLYRVPASGGELTLVSTSNMLSHPVAMAIRPDNGALFIADIGDPGGTGDEIGAVYRLALDGGSPRPFTMGEVRSPVGVAVSRDGQEVYVIGTDRTDGAPGLWRFAETGGGATPLFKGSPLVSPAGVVVANDGTIYLIDATALGPRDGAVLKVAPGSATVLTKVPLTVSFPAGIAAAGLTHPDVLITALQDGQGGVFRVTPTGDVAPVRVGIALMEPGSLQRAARSNAWVVVDTVTTQSEPGKAPGQLFHLKP